MFPRLCYQRVASTVFRSIPNAFRRTLKMSITRYGQDGARMWSNSVVRSVTPCQCRALSTGESSNARSDWRENLQAQRIGSRDDILVYLRDEATDREFYILGTAHISKKSAEDVAALIAKLQPDTVMVELCETRAAKIRGASHHELNAEDSSSFPSVLKAIASGSTNDGGYGAAPGPIQKLASLFGSRSSAGGHSSGKTEQGSRQPGADPFSFFADMLKNGPIGAAIQLFYRYLKTLGMSPGLEFKVAMESAEKIGARVVYGDQDIAKVMESLRNAFAWSDILKLLQRPVSKDDQELIGALLGEDKANMSWQHWKQLFEDPKALEALTERLKRRDTVRQMSKVTKMVPGLHRTLITDRDKFLTKSLKHHCHGRKIVAVVGMAHLDGIQDNWSKVR